MDRRPDARPMQSHAQPALDYVEPYAAAKYCMSRKIFLVLCASIPLESETSHGYMTHALSGTQENVDYAEASKGLLSD